MHDVHTTTHTQYDNDCDRRSSFYFLKYIVQFLFHNSFVKKVVIFYGILVESQLIKPGSGWGTDKWRSLLWPDSELTVGGNMVNTSKNEARTAVYKNECGFCRLG